MKEIEELKRYDKAYSEGKPLIDDTGYDKLWFDAKEKYPDDEYFKQSQPDMIIQSGKVKVKHPYPVQSLAKANTNDGIRSFLERWNARDKEDKWYTDKFVVEHKEDGLTVVLYFNEPGFGQFKAVTRGGGQYGIDVTETFMHFVNFSQDIIDKIGNEHVVVRGEAMIDDLDFEKIDDGQFMNSRNAASGTLMSKDPTVAEKRHMKFYAYEILNDISINSESSCLERLKEYGFEVTHDYASFQNNEQGHQDLIDFIESYETGEREKVGHAIDGLVIKPDYLGNSDKVVYNGHHPDNMIAYKFKAKEVTARLKEVIWQKAASGRLTPVGVLDKPVELMGAMISRASLASIQNIETRDLMLNDVVVVRRSNDVIPQIIASVKDYRDGTQIDIHDLIPEGSRRVGALLFAPEDIDLIYFQIWAKSVENYRFAIDGMSGKTLELLRDNDLIDIKDLSSLFRLKDEEEEFMKVKGFGKGKFDKMTNAIKSAEDRPISLKAILEIFPIDGLGGKLADEIAKRIDISELFDVVGSGDQIRLASIKTTLQEDVTSQKGFGQKANDVIEKLFTMYDGDFLKQLYRLSDHVNFVNEEESIKTDVKSGNLNGMAFVLTGKMPMTRKEVTKLIESNGGTVLGGINKKNVPDYLVDGNDGQSNSSKAKAAKSLGVKVISFDDLNRMI